jgi:hypothetical protein
MPTKKISEDDDLDIAALNLAGQLQERNTHTKCDAKEKSPKVTLEALYRHSKLRLERVLVTHRDVR